MESQTNIKHTIESRHIPIDLSPTIMILRRDIEEILAQAGQRKWEAPITVFEEVDDLLHSINRQIQDGVSPFTFTSSYLLQLPEIAAIPEERRASVVHMIILSLSGEIAEGYLKYIYENKETAPEEHSRVLDEQDFEQSKKMTETLEVLEQKIRLELGGYEIFVKE